ncbi:MAG TPA: class I SAM-dependent methyltransferase [Methanocella sp.]|uniref:class I SAM-dependent methyltransferase n=1 Tax=Methanocella sp. TaxID=2052833 RepID=UPI002BAB7FC4|nr:class I SAM-dependent methyltransferase [Methanocella sp.]HTY91452.1 class I SAM-dependent methyltransferase [Methanocella sp.]
MTLRDLLARLEPEAIPFPFSRLYSWLASSRMVRDYYESVAAQVLERVHIGRILDIGTGPGRLPLAIASKNRYVHVTGLDLSADMVKIASRLPIQNGAANIDFKAGNAGELPFGDREFDLVISTLSFHHWKEPEKALDEIYRVLREGGEAWIYDIPSKVNPTVWSEMKKRYGFIASTFMHFHTLTEPFYDEKRLGEIAAASRFKKYEIDYRLFTYRLRLYK